MRKQKQQLPGRERGRVQEPQERGLKEIPGSRTGWNPEWVQAMEQRGGRRWAMKAVSFAHSPVPLYTRLLCALRGHTGPEGSRGLLLQMALGQRGLVPTGLLVSGHLVLL